MKSIASRLWPEPVRVDLFFDHIAAERRARGRPLTIRNTQVKHFTPGHWRSAVLELNALLSAVGSSRASVEIVISNRLVRYFCLPWSVALRTEADWQSFAAHRFIELFGARAEDHTIRIAPAARSARIACAVEKALIDSIRNSLAGAGHRLAFLKPRFAVAFELARQRLAKGDVWLVDYEPDQLTLGLALAGEWRAIRQRRAQPDWREHLAEILAREASLVGVSHVEPVFLA
jgi:hypothetical protein